jgi:hypothetical protein
VSKQVNIQMGGEAGSQHRWSCLSCGTMGPWTSQTLAAIAGEAHADEHHDDAQRAHHRDEDLDEILQNLAIPIQGDDGPL